MDIKIKMLDWDDKEWIMEDITFTFSFA